MFTVLKNNQLLTPEVEKMSALDVEKQIDKNFRILAEIRGQKIDPDTPIWETFYPDGYVKSFIIKHKQMYQEARSKAKYATVNDALLDAPEHIQF